MERVGTRYFVCRANPRIRFPAPDGQLSLHDWRSCQRTINES